METEQTERVALDEAVASIVRTRRKPVWPVTRRAAKRAVLLALAALPFAAWAYIANYQPLSNSFEFGRTFMPPQGERCQTWSHNFRAPASGEDFMAIRVQCLAGGEADWGWSWGHEGPLPIRVERVAAWDGPHLFLDARVGGVATQGIPRFNALPEWRSFALEPGDTKVFAVRFRGPFCRPEPGGYSTVTDLEIHFKVLGIPRRDRVPTPWSAQIAC